MSCVVEVVVEVVVVVVAGWYARGGWTAADCSGWAALGPDWIELGREGRTRLGRQAGTGTGGGRAGRNRASGGGGQ